MATFGRTLPLRIGRVGHKSLINLQVAIGGDALDDAPILVIPGGHEDVTRDADAVSRGRLGSLRHSFIFGHGFPRACGPIYSYVEVPILFDPFLVICDVCYDDGYSLTSQAHICLTVVCPLYM